MKDIYLSIIIIISIISFSCTPKITQNTFTTLNNITVNIGESKHKKTAAEFEKIYNEHHKNPNFQEKLLNFIRAKEYKELNAYYWFSTFLTEEYYMNTIDYDLSTIILDDGLIEINKRLENKDKSDDEQLHLEMTKCQLLWRYGIISFTLNKNQEGCKYFDQAYFRKEEPTCIYAFPAMEKEEKKEIYKKYNTCKK